MEKFTFNANADLVQQVTNFYNVADISENVEVVFNSPFDREKLPMIFQEFRRQNGLINGFCCDDSQGICYLTTSIGKLHTVDYDIEEIIEAIDLYCKEKPIIKFDISVEELAGEEANISKIQDYAFTHGCQNINYDMNTFTLTF